MIRWSCTWRQSIGREARHARRKWDGVEALPDGRILVSSWSDSSVHVLGPDGKRIEGIRPIPEPADIGVDTRRGHVAIPVSVMGRVEVWSFGTPR
jgi:hypothetical protein